jgi:TRAP-type mannitol/chloroaromatic compound transport system permease large subunit
LVPGLLLVLLYVLYILGIAFLRPDAVPAHRREAGEAVTVAQVIKALAPPLILIFAVLGSILNGLATPTEAAGVGGMGALLLAITRGGLNLERLRDIMRATLRISSMVFLILTVCEQYSRRCPVGSSVQL